MIQHLRRKIIRNNMVMVCLVLAIVLLAVITVSVYQTEAEIQTALTRTISSDQVPGLPQLDIPARETQNMPKDGENPTENNVRDDDDDERATMLSYQVFVDTEGNIVDTQGVNVEVTDAMAKESVNRAMNSGRADGLLPGLRLQFASVTNEFGTRYAFVDISAALSRLLILCTISLLFYAAAFVTFYFISRYMADIAVRPVEAALQQQQQFLADASHELKTPLTVILANLDILNSHPEHTIAQEQKWVGYIQSEASRMKGLVESLLFLARADRNQNPVVKETLNLSDLMWECILPFEPVAFEAGLTSDSDIEDGIFVSGNPAQLKQLVMILLDNACKYTPSGGSIMVSLHRQESGCQLSVNNLGGAPIPAEKLPHLFERFYRADDSRNWKTGGYGLGLSIAETVVHNHEGTITVASSAEHGTTFSVTLPTAVPELQS